MPTASIPANSLTVALLLLLPVSLMATPADAGSVVTADTTTAGQSGTASSLQPFRIQYKTRYELGWFSFDIDGERQLEALPDNRWRFSFNAEASIASLQESSEFTLHEQQIQPLNYRFQTTGLLNKPTETLLFSPESQQIIDAQNNHHYTDQWQPGIQNNLSFMLQISLDLAQGKTELHYPVFDRNKIRELRFEILGEETINTPLGQLQAIKIQQIRSNSKREIFAWLAPQHQYQMVRLAYHEKGKLRYRIDVSSIE